MQVFQGQPVKPRERRLEGSERMASKVVRCSSTGAVPAEHPPRCTPRLLLTLNFGCVTAARGEHAGEMRTRSVPVGF